MIRRLIILILIVGCEEIGLNAEQKRRKQDDND